MQDRNVCANEFNGGGGQMGWIDFVIILVIGLSIWSGYRGGTVRSTISIVGMIAGIEFASRNFQRFAKELAPMVHSLEAANATWFILQIFIVLVAFGFVGHAIQNEIGWMEHEVMKVKTTSTVGQAIQHEIAWVEHEVEKMQGSSLDGILGGLLGLVRGVVLGAVCMMSVAAFFPNSDTLPDALLPKYMAGTTAVLANLTAKPLHRKIIMGIDAMEAGATAPDGSGGAGMGGSDTPTQ